MVSSISEKSKSKNNVDVKKKITFTGFWKAAWKNEKLLIFLVIGVILGFLVGCLANKDIQKLPEPTRTDALIGIEFIGSIFLQCLRLVILPLVMASLIRGMASLGTQSASRIGVTTLVYYIVTSILACVLGLILVVSIAPGKRATYNITKDDTIIDARPLDLFLDLVRNLFPDNIVQACFQSIKTNSKSVSEYINVERIPIPPGFEIWDENLQKEFMEINNVINITQSENGTIIGYNGTLKTYMLPSGQVYNNGINMLGIITFCIVFGVFLGTIKEKGDAFLQILESIEIVSIKMIHMIMYISPLGIFSLIVGQFWRIDDIPNVFKSLALYLVTVIAGLIIHLFFTTMIIYFGITKKNPLIFFKNMTKAILTAFATASSSATMPVTLECLDENNKIDPRVSRFMIPIGATVNMDGLALYEAVAAIFISQVYGVNLSAGNIIVTFITATLTSIGAAGVPQGGLVTLVIVLQVVGLPPNSIGLILSIDWLLDRLMTISNIMGDAFGCGVVEHLNKKFLKRTRDYSTSEETNSVEVTSDDSDSKNKIDGIKLQSVEELL